MLMCVVYLNHCSVVKLFLCSLLLDFFIVQIFLLRIVYFVYAVVIAEFTG